MPFYIDTSAMVKRYVFEDGSDVINRLCNILIKRNEKMYTASHTISEFGSAVMRLYREGKYSKTDALSYINFFLEECTTILVFIDITKQLSVKSLRVLTQYPLKGADSLHLTAAIDAFSFFGPDLYFVCDDKRLCDAAFSKGMNVLKPSENASIEYLESL